MPVKIASKNTFVDVKYEPQTKAEMLAVAIVKWFAENGYHPLSPDSIGLELGKAFREDCTVKEAAMRAFEEAVEDAKDNAAILLRIRSLFGDLAYGAAAGMEWHNGTSLGTIEFNLGKYVETVRYYSDQSRKLENEHKQLKQDVEALRRVLGTALPSL